MDLTSLFTNRNRAKQQFLAALDNRQGTDRYRALNWYGVGGQGKTALLEEFERILQQRSEDCRARKAPRLGYALIDFENPNNRAIATAMLSIREKLRETAGLHCPTFEAALLRYFMMSQPGTNIKDLRAQFFHTGSDVLDGVIQALGAAAELGAAVQPLPGFGLLSKYGAQLAGKASHAFYTWWNKRGIRSFAEIEGLSQDALLRRLPTYLGADLMDALAEPNPPRIVILFDTYEALWRGQGLRDGPGMLRIDDWVRQLVQDARGVLFVIAGRDRLQWSEVDEAWSAILESHPLGGLSRRDAEILLGNYQVVEPGIRDRMIAGARSQEFGEVDPGDDTSEAYLPFYLTLQAGTYQDIKVGGRTPETEDFGGDHPLILARFLEHLDTETDKLLRLASYPSTMDMDVLNVVADQFLGGHAAADWARLYARSVVSEEREGSRHLHGLLRQALQERERRERPELYREIHQALFAWFAGRSEEPDPKDITLRHERCFLAALRHLSRFDEHQAVRWSIRQMQRFSAAARWRVLEEACTVVLPIAERAFGPEDQWTTANLGWLARVYRDTGRYAEAERLFERVRAIYEKTLGTEHPSFTTTLHELARVYGDTGRYAEAERLFEQVRAIYEKTLGTEHPSFAATLHNLAGVYRDTGRYAEAERLCEQVRAIQEKTLGRDHPAFATTLHNLAIVYSDTGRYADGERLCEQVRAIREKTLGTEHPSFAAMLYILARVYSDTGRYAEAERLFEQVQGILEKTLGTEHPYFAAMLHNLARVYSDTGRYADAERLFEQVQGILEKTLGTEHPFFATALTNLAGVYRDTGRYAEAEPLLEQAMAVYTMKLPPGHPRVARLLVGRGRLSEKRGETAAARNDYQEAVAILVAAGVQPGERWLREALEGLTRLA